MLKDDCWMMSKDSRYARNTESGCRGNAGAAEVLKSPKVVGNYMTFKQPKQKSSTGQVNTVIVKMSIANNCSIQNSSSSSW